MSTPEAISEFAVVSSVRRFGTATLAGEGFWEITMEYLAALQCGEWDRNTAGVGCGLGVNSGLAMTWRGKQQPNAMKNAGLISLHPRRSWLTSVAPPMRGL